MTHDEMLEWLKGLPDEITHRKFLLAGKQVFLESKANGWKPIEGQTYEDYLDGLDEWLERKRSPFWGRLYDDDPRGVSLYQHLADWANGYWRVTRRRLSGILEEVFGPLLCRLPAGTPMTVGRDGYARPARQGEAVVGHLMNDFGTGRCVILWEGMGRLDVARSLSPEVLPWMTPLVRQIAQDVYQEDFSLVGVLADALEDAGCRDEYLDHLREPRQHFRGCWVLDAILETSWTRP